MKKNKWPSLLLVDSAHSQPVISADEISWLRIVMGIKNISDWILFWESILNPSEFRPYLLQPTRTWVWQGDEQETLAPIQT